MPKCYKCLKPMPGNNGVMLCRMCKGKAAILKDFRRCGRAQ